MNRSSKMTLRSGLHLSCLLSRQTSSLAFVRYADTALMPRRAVPEFDKQ